MSRSTVPRAVRAIVSVAVASVALGVAAGCGDDDKKSSKAKSFAVEATAQGKSKLKLTFPATVEAGLVTLTLKNSDTKPRSAAIVRVVGDQGVDDVLKVINAEDAPIPAFVEDGGGTGDVAPGKTATVTQNLAPGKYVIYDEAGGGQGGPSNNELGAKGEFTVTGEAKDDELPSVPATVTATDKGTRSYDFAVKNLKAGANRVRFENTGKQLHHAVFFPINEGSTLSDVKKFLKATGQPTGPPPVDFEKGADTAVIDGGIEQNTELQLQAGRYALLCFIPDRKGGRSHFSKGMIEEIAVK